MIIPLTEYSGCLKVTEHNPNAMHSSPQNKETMPQITSEIYLQFLGILLISEKSSSGCLEKMVLVKSKSCLCEGQQTGFHLHLPFTNMPLSCSIPNLVPHLKRLVSQDKHANTVDCTSMGWQLQAHQATEGFIMRPAEEEQEHTKHKTDSRVALEITRSVNESKLQLILGRLKYIIF